MQVTNPDDTIPAGPMIVVAQAFRDHRGSFCETWSQRDFELAGIRHDWVQDNQAVSHTAGTIRGLHFQAPPHAQAKLVRVARGRIMDVAVDARRGSPTYGRCVCEMLSEKNGRELLVPRGFLHGYMTLEPDTIVHYKVDAPYAKEAEGAVVWNDPDLGIDWSFPEGQAIVSDKDVEAPRFADFNSPFVYEA